MKKAENTEKSMVDEANLDSVSGGIVADITKPQPVKPVTKKPDDETADFHGSVAKDALCLVLPPRP